MYVKAALCPRHARQRNETAWPALAGVARGENTVVCARQAALSQAADASTLGGVAQKYAGNENDGAIIIKCQQQQLCGALARRRRAGRLRAREAVRNKLK